MLLQKFKRALSMLMSITLIITFISVFTLPSSAVEKYLEPGDSISLDEGGLWINHSANWDVGVNGQEIVNVPGGKYLHFAGNSTRGGCGVTLDLDGLTANTAYTITCDIIMESGVPGGVRMSTDCGGDVWVGSSKTVTIISNVNIGDKETVKVTIRNTSGDVTPYFDITKLTVYQGISTTPYKVYDFENNVPAIGRVHGAWCGTPDAMVEVEESCISVAETLSGNNPWSVNQRAVYCQLSEPLTLEAGTYKLSCQIRPLAGNADGKRGFGIKLFDGIKNNGNHYAAENDLGAGNGDTYVTLNVDEWNSFERVYTFDQTVTVSHVAIRGGTSPEFDGGAYDIRGLKLENTSPAEVMMGDELIADGSCEENIPAGLVTGSGHSKAELSYDSANECVTVSEVTGGSDSFKYITSIPGGLDETHTYRFSFSLRTANASEKSRLRVYSPFGGAGPVADGDSNTQIEITGRWTTFVYTIDSTTNTGMFSNGQIGILLHGYNENKDGYAVGFRELQIDNISLVDLTPAGVEGNLISNGSFDSRSEDNNLVGWSENNPNYTVKTKVVDGTGVIMLDGRTDTSAMAVFNSDAVLNRRKFYELSITLRTRSEGSEDTVCLYTLNASGEKVPVILDIPAQTNEMTASGNWNTYTANISSDKNSDFYDNGSVTLLFGASEDGFGTLYIDEIILVELEEKEESSVPSIGIIMMLLCKKNAQNGEGDKIVEGDGKENKPVYESDRYLHFSGDDDGGAGLIDIDLGSTYLGNVKVTCVARVTDEYEKANTLTRTDSNRGRLRVQYKIGEESYTGCVADSAGAASDWFFPIPGQEVTVVDTKMARKGDSLKLSIYGDTEHAPAFDIMKITVYVNGEIEQVFDFSSITATPKYSIKWGRGTATVIND